MMGLAPPPQIKMHSYPTGKYMKFITFTVHKYYLAFQQKFHNKSAMMYPRCIILSW